ncbi:MAG: imidazole glycerol phosphate synthase subunit HisF, partial [Woeseiaceae bacterium]|nr:imidazole glycerol phosphate synthase subunit HisF [Woeseiaceae bacterium]
GSQCVVIGIASRKIADNWKVFQYTGDEQRSRNSERTTRDWVREVQERGAGEIVLNCMNQDGERNGFDIDQLISIQDCCDVPLIASGGAGSMRDFEQVFSVAGVSAALAASVFHNQDIAIPDLKRYLDAAGIEVRL